MDKQALISAGKEAARVALLAAVGFFMAYVSDLPETSTTAVVLLVLRFVDKYIHKSNKVTAKGLLPF